MKTKVCLINPPSVFLLDERVFMSLGILKIAASLEEKGYSVDLIDLSGIDNYEAVVRDYINYEETIIFGLTGTTPQMPAATNIAKTIRSARPHARIILGGPHVTLVSAAYKREQKLQIVQRATVALNRLQNIYDVLVYGDGDKAIFDAIKDTAPQVIDGDDPKSPYFLSNEGLASLPLPARHLVDIESYNYFIDGHKALSLIAQLGCPFACGFCGGRESPSLRRIRTRPTDNINSEILHLYHTYGIKGFMFYDDELNVSTEMVELMRKLSESQKKLGVEFFLRGFIKAELFNEEQAEMMYKAGFRWILVGFESGDPRILENINKKASQSDNTRCVNIAKKYGLKIKALMSIGHPGESKETIQETKKWLLEVQPDDVDITIITTYPGTPYYDHATPDPTRPDVWVYTYEPTGDRLYSYEVDFNVTAKYYKGDPDEGYQAYVFTDFLTSQELVMHRNELEKEIRQNLSLPSYVKGNAYTYEHSMGQSRGKLPSNILKSSQPEAKH